MSFVQYKCGVISICNYAAEGDDNVVGFSEVMVDYPAVLGPLAFYDTLTNLMEPRGRHPTTGEPLFVTEVDRYTGQVTTNGVISLESEISPPSGNPIDASIVRAGLTTAGVVQDIDLDASYLVWGMWAQGDVENQEALPPALQIWWVDAAVDSERKLAFDAFMLARGTSSAVLNDYWASNPSATYRTVGKDFDTFL